MALRSSGTGHRTGGLHRSHRIRRSRRRHRIGRRRRGRADVEFAGVVRERRVEGCGAGDGDGAVLDELTEIEWDALDHEVIALLGHAPHLEHAATLDHRDRARREPGGATRVELHPDVRALVRHHHRVPCGGVHRRNVAA